MGSNDHICGEPTKTTGEPCEHPVDGPGETCWRHGEDGQQVEGRPSHEPDEVTESVVEALAMTGHTQEEISDIIGISPVTLRKHYREILDQAKVVADAQVVQAAFQMAASGEKPSMTRYWLNCQANWESTQNVDVTSKGKHVNAPSRGDVLDKLDDMDADELARAWKDIDRQEGSS